MSILIIEDNAQLHELMVEKLHTSGFSTTSAFSGSEAKLVCQMKEFDLLLLDLMLPGMTGPEFLAWFRQSYQTPVIAISAIDDVSQKISLLEAGANDYLVKPFDLEELIARIRVQLRQEVVTPKRYHHGELSLDEQQREIRWKNEVIALTRQEYAILSLLIHYPHKVFTRRELIESAWDDYFEGDEQNLSVHVSNIRKKFRPLTDKEIIETVWGVGFRIYRL